jgi:hypothetical protein
LWAVLFNFDIDGHELKPAHMEFLARKAVPRLKDESVFAYLLGSASRSGAESHNRGLSERRAHSVAEFLQAHSVPSRQIKSTAVGEALAAGRDGENERHRAVAITIGSGRRRPPIVPTPKRPVMAKVVSREPHQHLAQGQLQFQLVVRTFIPYSSYATFPGDNRGFSMSPAATYRTGMFVVFDLFTGRITAPLAANSTGTKLPLLDWMRYANVDTTFRLMRAEPGQVFFHAHMEAHDPWVPIAPNIDTDIMIVAFIKNRELFVQGSVIGDAFPSTELFIRDNAGNGQKLLYFATPYNASGIGRLVGAGSRNLGDFKEGFVLDERARIVGCAPWSNADADDGERRPIRTG